MKRTEASLMKMTKKELVALILQEQVEDSVLGQKTKQELIDIILRKDDVEIRLKETIKSKDEEIDTLNNRIVGYEADINGLERMREKNLNSIEELKQALTRKRKIILHWQIATWVVLCISLIVIGCIL